MTKEEQIKFIEKEYSLYTNHTSNRRIRHDFFKNIQTELQAYLLGFYAADGSVDEVRKTMRVHLQKRDVEIVYLFKDIISPDARLYTIKPHETTGRNGITVQAGESIGVDITSTILVQDLVSIGFGYRKTWNENKFPDINPNLIRHFIRGYFDGDGTIFGWLAVETGKSDRIRYKFEICAKTKNLLELILELFKNLNIKINLNYLKRDDMYRISTSSRKEIEKIFHYLYDDSNFCLSRKFDKFNYYVNTEVNQLLIDHRNA